MTKRPDRIAEFEARPRDAKFKDSTERAAAQTMHRAAEECAAKGLSVKEACKHLRAQAAVFGKHGYYAKHYSEAAEREIKARGWDDSAPSKSAPPPSLF